MSTFSARVSHSPFTMTRLLLIVLIATLCVSFTLARPPKPVRGYRAGECPDDVFASACQDIGGCNAVQELRLRSLTAKYDDVQNPNTGANLPILVATNVSKTPAQLENFYGAFDKACPKLTANDVSPWLTQATSAALSVWAQYSGQYAVIAPFVDTTGAVPVSTENLSPVLSSRGNVPTSPNPVRTCLEGRCQYTIAGAGRRVPLLGDRTLCEGDSGDNFEQILSTAGQSICFDLIKDSYPFKAYFDTIATCRNNGDFVCTYTFKGSSYANVRDPLLA